MDGFFGPFRSFRYDQKRIKILFSRNHQKEEKNAAVFYFFSTPTNQPTKRCNSKYFIEFG